MTIHRPSAELHCDLGLHGSRARQHLAV